MICALDWDQPAQVVFLGNLRQFTFTAPLSTLATGEFNAENNPAGERSGQGVNSLNATEPGDKHQSDMQLQDILSWHDTKFSKLMRKQCKESIRTIDNSEQFWVSGWHYLDGESGRSTALSSVLEHPIAARYLYYNLQQRKKHHTYWQEWTS